ncbi:hypothetical protein SAMN05216255_3980 [Pseudomonas segetis]|uniref:Uncharacterized protein n=1 Tax=Pseudomonas segetis TaxID=298908 RepID=A0A239IS74_9PSED|nr:hypothetical protein SAMN05216255_3980 [Pseudomonas segetis]
MALASKRVKSQVGGMASEFMATTSVSESVTTIRG